MTQFTVGTEKQMVWAEAIRTKVVNIINSTMTQMKTDPRYATMPEANKAQGRMWEQLAENISNCEDARAIINVYKNVETMRDVMVAYKTTNPETEAEATITMKR